jgi:hypothetical protein
MNKTIWFRFSKEFFVLYFKHCSAQRDVNIKTKQKACMMQARYDTLLLFISRQLKILQVAVNITFVSSLATAGGGKPTGQSADHASSESIGEPHIASRVTQRLSKLVVPRVAPCLPRAGAFQRNPSCSTAAWARVRGWTAEQETLHLRVVWLLMRYHRVT